MCCFSRPVISVAATRIFARDDADGRQFLVYSMTLDAAEELAMVLPLPVPRRSGEDAARFIDLHEYPTFFNDLEKGFPAPRALGRAKSAVPPPGPAPKLAVVEVGEFEASFVPTVADFARLDERFQMPPGTWEKLPVYRDYGFAVFKLKPGAKRVHPMAFSFPRADPDTLFFPTVHIHDGRVHDRARFDHALYYQPGDGPAYRGALRFRESDRPVSMFMDIAKAKGLLDPGQHCYRHELGGLLANRDTLLARA